MTHHGQSSSSACTTESVSNTLNSAFQTCTDTSDAVEFFIPQQLYLKPVARLNVSVQLPQLKLPGKTISNWEVMEKLKGMVKPIQFTVLKVSKSTLEFIRFEGEIENKANLPGIISRLDGRTIKLSGFSELLKIRAAEAKSSFPTRHTWDSYFRDAKNMNEMKAGERPDTIHLSNLPSRWFSSKHDSIKGNDKPSEYIFRKAFEQFGEVRHVDIPMLDPYRSLMKAHISGLKTFSFGQEHAFEGYVQFQEYVCFVKAMDALRGMKLLHKEGSKAHTASIKVDFDCSKHLSDASIRRRRLVREKLMAKERELEEQERKAKEIADKEAEDLRKKQEEEERQRAELEEKHKQKKAERHQARQLRRLKREEAQRMNYKIAVEERKLLIAQRKLESIRLLDELFERVKIACQKENALKQSEEAAAKSKANVKEAVENGQEDDLEKKEKELRLKLMKKLKSRQEQELLGRQEKLRQTIEGKNKLRSVLASSKPSKQGDGGDSADSDSSTTSGSSSQSVKQVGTKSESGATKSDKKDAADANLWFGVPPVEYHPGFMGANGPPVPLNMNPQLQGRFVFPSGGFYGGRGQRQRWPRSRLGGGYNMMNNYYYEMTDDYYKYFSRLASTGDNSYSRSRSLSPSRSRPRRRRQSRSSRSRSRSRSKSRKNSRPRRTSRSNSHSRSRYRRSRTPPSKASNSKSHKPGKSRSRSHSKLRSPNHNRVKSSSRKSSSKTRSRSRSRSHSHSKKSRGSSRNDTKGKKADVGEERPHMRSLSKDLSLSPAPAEDKANKNGCAKKKAAHDDKSKDLNTSKRKKDQKEKSETR